MQSVRQAVRRICRTASSAWMAEWLAPLCVPYKGAGFGMVWYGMVSACRATNLLLSLTLRAYNANFQDGVLASPTPCLCFSAWPCATRSGWTCLSSSLPWWTDVCAEKLRVYIDM
jgi:hypothetical protein